MSQEFKSVTIFDNLLPGSSSLTVSEQEGTLHLRLKSANSSFTFVIDNRADMVCLADAIAEIIQRC